jgi:hypothetical protein
MTPVAYPKLVAPLKVNGKSYSYIEDAQSDLLMPSSRMIKLDEFAGAGGLLAGPGIPRGLWVGTAGAADMIDGYGDVMSGFPLQVGYNPVVVSEITTLSSAANVWGIY